MTATRALAADASRPSGTGWLDELPLELREVKADVRAGRIGQAMTRIDGLSGRLTGGVPHAVLTALLVECRLARGDLDAADEAGAGLARHLTDTGAAAAVAHYGLGEIAAARGDAALSLRHHLSSGSLLDDPDGLPWRAGAVLALVRVGRLRDAVELASEQLALARESGSSYVVGLALRTQAAADPGPGRIALLREARCLLADDPVGGRLRASVEADIAGLLLLSQDPAAAQEALVLIRGLEEWASAERMRPLQGRIRRMLERLGESPRRLHGEALAALTGAERRVALLAATGLTNRQIGVELGVSTKAVEWHLSHVYRKLAIRSRAALAPTLGTFSLPRADAS